MTSAALCLGCRVGHRASFPHETFARRQHPLRRVPQRRILPVRGKHRGRRRDITRVAAVVVENERVRRS